MLPKIYRSNNVSHKKPMKWRQKVNAYLWQNLSCAGVVVIIIARSCSEMKGKCLVEKKGYPVIHLVSVSLRQHHGWCQGKCSIFRHLDFIEMLSPGFIYELYSPTNCPRWHIQIQQISPVNQPNVFFNGPVPMILWKITCDWSHIWHDCRLLACCYAEYKL